MPKLFGTDGVRGVANIEPMTAEDLANTILWVASQPPHLNFNSIELMPTRQNWAGFATNRQS